MRPVVTPGDMAAADRRAIERGVPEAVLVERAGRAVAGRARHLLGGTYGRRVVVACGKGNNGADGRVAARLLAARGVGVETFAIAGEPTQHPLDQQAFERAIARADLFIDAMFGTGFRGGLTDPAAWIAATVRQHGNPVLSVDIPSGVDGGTGLVEGDAVRATETVCFAALKPGLLFEPGRAHAGRVRVVDIGIDTGPSSVGVAEVEDLVLPQRAATAHKWSSAMMVVGGSTGMTGAPMMTARAAARCGAGMVVCGVPGRDAAARMAASEIVARALPMTDDGAMDEDAAKVVLDEAARFRALALGPGLGRDVRTREAVRRLVTEAPIPLVVDADALNALPADDGPLAARREAGLPRPVLTPHAGEYERIAGRPVGPDRVAAASELARRTDAVVLLKGPGTVIATPEGETRINATDTPALATAGTGDVLTGIVGGLLAAGADAFAAAVTGAYVHGRAACAAGTAPDLVAVDLIGALHRTLDALRSGRDPWEE